MAMRRIIHSIILIGALALVPASEVLAGTPQLDANSFRQVLQMCRTKGLKPAQCRALLIRQASGHTTQQPTGAMEKLVAECRKLGLNAQQCRQQANNQSNMIMSRPDRIRAECKTRGLTDRQCARLVMRGRGRSN